MRRPRTERPTTSCWRTARTRESAPSTCGLRRTARLLPAWWGRGIGAWLLAELCRRAKEAGATRVWLRVNKRNVRAQKAYRAAGFANVRALCTDIGGGFVMDDFVFERRLP